jgi:hypothetical protein
VKTKPAGEPLKPKADGAAGPTLSHMSPAYSAHAAVEDLEDVQNAQSELEPEPKDTTPPEVEDHPKDVQNAESKLEPEPADAGSSSGAEPGPKTLWDEAYNTLRDKNPKLIDAYEKELLASQDSNQQGTSTRIGFL